MDLSSILSASLSYFSTLSKKVLIKTIIDFRDKYIEIAAQNQRFTSQISELKEEVETLKAAQTQSVVAQVNKSTNRPSSKQPEWESKGVGNDGKGKKKGRGKKGRKGGRKPIKEPYINQKGNGKRRGLPLL